MIDTSTPRLGGSQPPADGGGDGGRGGRRDAGGHADWWTAGRLLVFRFRVLGCCLLLAALPFATAPGDIISDTKFELAVNPTGFLSSALTLWDPQQFGGLQDQVVGYLFPMGPFFEVLHIAAVEGWIIQRLWIGSLLAAAFAGTVRLADRMDIGTPGTRVAAGFGYALSPAVLSILGDMSGEVLPMVMLPWILIPLTDMRPWTRDAGFSGRVRVVARSAVAVALCSGMNAASTAAVLVPVVIYILTRRGGISRIRILLWWCAGVVIASLSWLIPLALLGKYGVSIVLYTESAQVTSSATSLVNIFRGTENWVSYLVVNGAPWRPLGLQIATDLVPAVLLGLLAAAGLAGLVRRDIPERRFLLWSALAGMAVISLGYVSSLGNPLEGPLISFINGPASPFRNLWKFDPMVRLPLVLGLAHLLATARLRRTRAALGWLVVIGFSAIVVPSFATGLASEGSFPQVPSYWVNAASWLTAHAGRQAILVEPGAAFGQYVWGSPMDDVLQALTSADFAERNLSTIGSPGNERLLSDIDSRMAAGDGSAGLTEVLARMGVKYIVVRNDLSRSELNGAWPARISDALATSPGITLAAQFGPTVGGLGPRDAVTDFDAPYPAVQIYQVAGPQSIASVQPAASTLRVYGAPESLTTLADAGLLGNRPVLINNDGAGLPTAGDIVTDSLRRRVVNFGQLRADYSPTLTATDPATTFLSTDDYTEPGWSRYQAVAQYAGIKNVTASSSSSDLGALPTQWASGTLPYSAVDGNLATMWESGSWTGPVGQWIQVTFDGPLNPHTIRVAFADNAAIGPPVTQVTVSTAAGQVTDPVRVTGDLQALPVPSGASGWLRITVTGLEYQPPTLFGTQVGIAGIVVPGVTASRTIVAPFVPGGDPSAVVLSKAQPQPTGCMLTSLRWVCSPQLSTLTEEQYGFNQTFELPAAEQTAVTGSAILTDSSLAGTYARLDPHAATVTGSSAYTSDPQDQPRSAFDGNPATTWIASPLDQHPRLTISWGYKRTLSKITIERPPGVSGLLQVLIAGSGGQLRGGLVGTSGVVRFAPMKTTSLTLTFTVVQAPLQITDVVIPGVPSLGTPSGPFRLPCGYGPLLRIDGQAVPTKVSGTFTDLLNARPMQFTACSMVTLTAGSHQVTEIPTDSFDIQDVVLRAAPGSAGPDLTGPDLTGPDLTGPDLTGSVSPPAPATIVSWTSSVRRLRVDASSRSYLIVNENYNLGWHAVVSGKQLQPVRLDGWKQAWVLPAGTRGLVTLTYQPESLYRDAVVGGLAALVLLLLVAFVVFRPGRQPGELLRWPPERRGPRWVRWIRWAGLAGLCALLAGTGLVLGGYPGAVIVPAMAVLFARPVLARYGPWALAGLLVVASGCDAVGVHLALSGDIGLVVSAPANAIPQVLCLIVVGGMAGALIAPAAREE
jgi:arabinofuranan 3-O-arabinosyltransferase